MRHDNDFLGDVDQRVAEARAEEAAIKGLGRLDGSPKQIAWAAGIRRGYLDRGGRDVITKAQRSAKWWIDNRHDLP